ncbi:MAG: hypothetical protein FJZ56_02240 [Chlamydiae bacterium]|nr:hypothetical protein [Chlamydiota bacterium]
MDVAIITNHFPTDLLREEILQCQKRVVVDGAITYLDNLGIIPDLWVTDFDEIEEEYKIKYAHIRTKNIHKTSPIQDTEVAIEEALSFKPERIFLFTNLESAIDSFLALLLLAGKYPDTLYIVTPKQTAFAFSKHLLLSISDGQKIHFMAPFGPVKIQSCQGIDLCKKQSLFTYEDLIISATALAHVIEMEISKGKLLCIVESSDH